MWSLADCEIHLQRIMANFPSRLKQQLFNQAVHCDKYHKAEERST